MDQIDFFRSLFIGREDVFAEQLQQNDKSYYSKVGRAIEDNDIATHLKGINTYGTYVISKNNTCKFITFDIDIPKGAETDNGNWEQVKNKVLQLKINAVGLGVKKTQLITEYSGRRGYHVWILFEENIPSWEAYAFAKLILIKSKVQCEIFPKQSKIDSNSGFGCVIKLPLGIHKTSNQRSEFVTESFEPHLDQFLCLSKVELVSNIQLKGILSKYEQSLEGEVPLKPYFEVQSNITFDLDRKGGSIDKLLSGCKALMQLKEKAQESQHLTHQERLAIVNLLPLLGNEGELQVHEIIGNCNDYNAEHTQREIEYRKQKKYKPLSCNKMKEWGFCSHDCGLVSKNGHIPSPIQFCWDKHVLPGGFDMINKENGTLIIEKNGFSFNVSNTFVNKNISKVRLGLTGSNGLIYSDTVSLHSGKSRKQFINSCLKMKNNEDMNSKSLEKYLMEIEQVVQEEWGNPPNECDKSSRCVPEIPQDEKEKAIDFLKNPSILEIIKNDLRCLDHVGDDDVKLVLYVACTSRKLDKPLACVVKGESSSGKNSLVNTVLNLMPPEDTKIISRATPHALEYYPEEELKNIIIFVAEKPGAEEADYSVRTLLSEGQLRTSVAIKNPKTGLFETVDKKVAGPVVYIETTTQPKINYENDTRLINLYVDESEEQTKRIHDAQRKEKTIKGLSEEVFKEDIKKKHQNAQRLLRLIGVVIPYAEHITFPTHSVRTRRDHEKFLYLIKTITFLRQYQKEVKHEGNLEYIEADIKDYELAFELTNKVLSQSIYEVSKRSRELMEIIETMVLEWVEGEKPGVEFVDKETGYELTNIVLTRADVRKYAKSLSDTALHSCMKELGSYELLKVIQGGQGRTNKYTVAGGETNSFYGSEQLLSPEELKNKISPKLREDFLEKDNAL